MGWTYTKTGVTPGVITEINVGLLQTPVAPNEIHGRIAASAFFMQALSGIPAGTSVTVNASGNGSHPVSASIT